MFAVTRPMPTRSGSIAAGEVRLSALPRGDRPDAAHALPIVLDFDRRDPRLVPAHPAAPDHHARVGVAVRKRREHDASHHAKHCRRRAHAERKGEDGDDREPWFAPQPAHAVTDVLKEKVHDADCAEFLASSASAAAGKQGRTAPRARQ